MLSMLISSIRQQGDDIGTYLAALIKDLKLLSLLQIWVLMTQVLRHKDFQRHNFYIIEATVKKGYLTTL